LQQAWALADRLRWIQWGGAGVDAVLFPELAASDVLLTNARGVFDRAMAEYTLGLILAFGKEFSGTYTAQREHRWSYRLTELMAGRSVLVVGVGSIGREIARMLKRMDFVVSGVGRSARGADPDFGDIHGVSDLNSCLPQADYVVLITPLTPETRDLFGTEQFCAMKSSARFINLGRGELVDESALLEALQGGQIAGAGLDVFCTEPLPTESPFWDLDNVIVSPHMSGDYQGHQEAMAEVFLENFERFRDGRELLNQIDKSLGFAKI
ncbi:MAG: D-2-hydroxyacid dehydrogenase, partial [Pseudomonadota bacterium]|nr:D-2-hydroxyacid dehydrogenase [Pseudomonadota bacterium]